MSQPNIQRLQTVSHDQNQSMGRLLLDLGKLSTDDAERVLRHQKDKNIRFGDAAIELGLITRQDIQQVLSHQFDYRYIQPGQGNYSNELVAAYQPFSPQVEALRAIRSQLMLRWFAEHKLLALVGANSNDGRSYLAANLAVVFSQLGERTLLIDANLRKPRQHELFNLAAGHGLSDILAHRADMECIKRIEHFVDLSVLSAGTIAPNPQELINRPLFKQFLANVADHFDVVLIDTSPALENADAQAISVLAGGALMVARKNHTRLSELMQVQAQITDIGTELVGTVINEY